MTLEPTGSTRDTPLRRGNETPGGMLQGKDFMKGLQITFALVIVCVGVYLLARHHERAVTSGSGWRPGQFAPEFALQDLNGRPLTLAEYRGKVVLLNFWATWCEPCRQEIPEFVQLQNNTHGIQILGISLDDSVEPVRAFYTDFKMNYPVALGDAALAQRYGGVLGLPISFMIGCDGRVSERHVGQVSIRDIERELGSLAKASACAQK